ncbi:MAG TPA: lactonase family protein [Chthoniobacterales bacterium]
MYPPLLRLSGFLALLVGMTTGTLTAQAEGGGGTGTFDLLVGTYTSGESKGIYVFRFDAVSGNLEPLAAPAETVNPSFLVVRPDRNFVYAVNETHGADPGAVSAFRFDPASGSLRFLNKVPSNGDDPCYVSLSADNRTLFVANYSSGNLSAVAVAPDGSLAGPVETLTHLEHGPNPERQKAAHVHMVQPSPDRRYLFATDLGNDRLYAYRCDAGDPGVPLTSAAPAFTAVAPGAGPRHFAFGPDGNFVYLIEEMGQAVVVFRRDGAHLEPLQTVRVAEKDWPADTGAAAIHASPDGRFMYASNRADANDLVIYAVAPATGLLTAVGHQSSLGVKPRDFCIDPTGAFLLVANQDSNNLVVFKRDQASGALTPVGKPLTIGSPVCLQMVTAGR